MRQSLTAVVERNAAWEGDFATEPWEAAWASEAIFYVRRLEASGAAPLSPSLLTASVQISPDGMHWCDEGHRLRLDGDAELAFVRVRHFGGWLRLCGRTASGVQLKVVAYLTLKE
ncbi:MAG: hypothetical protein ABIL09_03230 [Gemmatimonadota bacterium]